MDAFGNSKSPIQRKYLKEKIGFWVFSLNFPHCSSLWHRLVHGGFNSNPSCELGVRNYTQRPRIKEGTHPGHLKNERVAHFSEHVLANYDHNRL